MAPPAGRSAVLREWLNAQAVWPEAVLPDYDGGSVANLPASLLSAFGVERAGDVLPPVRAAALPAELLAGARVVVLVVLDGLGSLAFDRAAADGQAPGLRSLALQSRLTSVVPSTTTAALTSLQVGAAPARHGVVGYTLYLASVDRVVNMITFKPVDGGAFRRTPPDPARFVPLSSIYDRLSAAGIDSAVVSHAQYAESPLTRLQSRDARYVGHRTPAEFAWLLRREVARPGRRFIFGYWAGLDVLGHAAGPSAAICNLELQLLDQALRVGLFEPLAATRDDVAVLVTSDHGQVDLNPERAMLVGALRAAGDGWRHPPTGERRALGLAFKHDESRDAVAKVVGDAGVVLRTRDALAAGLLGPDPHLPSVAERIGELFVLARGNAAFLNRLPSSPDELMLGSHGSLTPEEMLVPLLAQRFGG